MGFPPIPVAARSNAWDCGFEFRQGHGYLSFVSVVYCQVQVFMMNLFHVQGSSTECGGSECCREASIMMRPSWGFCAKEEKRKIYGLSYPVRLGPTSVIATHCTG